MDRSNVALALALVGCAGARTAVPFEAGQKVAIEEGYRQDGQALDIRTLLDGLEQVQASREDAASARGWATTGLVLALPGGAAVGYGVAQGLLAKDSSDRSTGWIVAGAGAAVTGLALGAGAIADGKLRRAVESYNATLAGPAAAGSTLLPWLGATPDSRGGWVTVAGLHSRF